MPDVILLGDINIDVIAAIPAYPARGSEGVASTVEYYTGGSVVSTAQSLSALGVGVGIVGRIGNDALSAKVVEDLQQANIDISHVQIDSVVRTGMIYVVVNSDGERTMFSSRGANVYTEVSTDMETYFQNSRWYHFSGYSLLAEPQQSSAIQALEFARNARCRVSLDPGPEPAMRYGKQIRQLLPRIDVFLPNQSELMALTAAYNLEDAIQMVLDTGLRALVVKQGKHGALIAYDKIRLHIPAFDITVRDTTGAGDNFNAGLLLGRMVGLSWTAACILGNAMGALASATPGTGVSRLTPTRVIELIEKDTFKPQWETLYGSLDEVMAYLSAL